MPSKKTFVAIAKVIKDSRRHIDAQDGLTRTHMENIRLSIAAGIAQVLAQQNDKFDKSKFLKAAGGY
jgi:hypothetical protein